MVPPPSAGDVRPSAAEARGELSGAHSLIHGYSICMAAYSLPARTPYYTYPVSGILCHAYPICRAPIARITCPATVSHVSPAHQLVGS